VTPGSRLLLGAWGPPAAWCALLFVVSSLPLRTEGEVFRGGDKVVHGVEYAVLGLLLARALLRVRPGRSPGPVLATAAALATAYGFTDEVHQLLVPERAFEWGDLAADAAGGILGAALFVLAARRRPTAGDSAGSPDPRPSGPPGP
jgi:VanZ family protein